MDTYAWGHHAVLGDPLTPRDSRMSEAQLVAVLAALGHGLRLKLWRMLLPVGNHGLSAGTIAARMSVLPSSLSFHLRQMTQAGVLVQRRSSRQIIYAVNQDIIDGLVVLMATLTTSCDGSPVEPTDLIRERYSEGDRFRC
jgi:ArsR family transcriptional regulator